MLFGIALIDDQPFRITCDVVLRRGRGDIYVSGPVQPEIEETINESIGFGNTICDLDDREFPDLSSHDLLIRAKLTGHDAPIIGPSYGLLLSLGIVFALTRSSPTVETFITGGIDANGTVLPVGAIREKRKGAAVLGPARLVLPASQLDFFSTDVIQIPVESIFQAYSVLQYGKA